MNKYRWEKIIKIMSKNVIDGNSQFWDALNQLDSCTANTKDIISKKELMLIIDVLSKYDDFTDSNKEL